MTRRKKNKAVLNTIERFELFVRRVRELGDLRLVKSGMQWKLNISWEAKSGVFQYKPIGLDEDDLRSFLLLFRHFISASEPIFINRIFNDCHRFLTNERIRDEIQKARNDWNQQIRQGPISLNFRGTEITPEYALDLWINGHYFHNDPDKAAELERLLKLPLPLAHMQLLSTLPALTHIVFFVGQGVLYGLENNLFQISENQMMSSNVKKEPIV